MYLMMLYQKCLVLGKVLFVFSQDIDLKWFFLLKGIEYIVLLMERENVISSERLIVVDNKDEKDKMQESILG